MSDSNFNPYELQRNLKILQESNHKMLDKIKSLAKSSAEFEQETKKLIDHKHELEARVRVLEAANFEEIKYQIHKLNSDIQALQLKNDDNKEKFKRFFDFAIQLAWVSMAAWLLTKLGLQAPL
jgi:predicted transcriptional regulator